ncbi:WD repeat-containing protein 93 isoform X2 [Protopterus annectens]|uniref:WD repeat-containing protein 93 isoform X2 n=1 Tax=Protopterus annectens TaxID=7888 RepID=UPI001CFB1D8C|nr:WD repeat-containing protein 93 isoform X2 [Protopterus annectens]
MLELRERANCVTTSQDGRYIFAGLPSGIAAFSASTYSLVCTWEAKNVVITSIFITHSGKQLYLLATIDDMGLARLFSFSQDCFFLAKILNEPEDVSKRNNCTKFELSNGGDFAGVFLEGSGESWLEIYRLPKDSWPQELDQVPMTTQRQTSATAQPSGTSEGKSILPVLVMKIKPPKPISGSAFRSPAEALQKSDEGIIIGSGQNNIISTHQWQQQRVLFEHLFRKKLQMSSRVKEVKSRQAMCHFLLPGRILPTGLESASHAAVPSAVCVCWNGCHNLLRYSLLKPAKDKDIEPKPDVVWPCAASIACSCVSLCNSFLAVGFVDGTLTVWDRYLGLPLSVTTLPEDSEITNIQFLDSLVDYQKFKPVNITWKNAKPQLLVLCRNGALYHITAKGGNGTFTVRLTEGSKPAESMICIATPVPFLPGLVLLVSRNGTVSLLDSTEGVEVCCLDLPSAYTLSSPWDPIFAIDTEHQSILLQADRNMCAENAADVKPNSSSLVVFSFTSTPLLEEIQQRKEKATIPLELVSLERRSELYFQARLQSHNARNKQMNDCWQNLRRHAAMVRQQKVQ